MRRRADSSVILAFLFLSLVPSGAAARASDGSPIRRGAVEMMGAFSFSHNIDKEEALYLRDGINSGTTGERTWKQTTLTVSPGTGWFLTDKTELVGRLRYERTWSQSEIGGEKQSDSYTWNAGAAALLYRNIPNETAIVPFCGAGIGARFVKDQDKTAVAFPRLQMGIRCLVGDATSLNVGFSYAYVWNGSLEYIVDDGDGNEFGFFVGISVFVNGREE